MEKELWLRKMNRILNLEDLNNDIVQKAHGDVRVFEGIPVVWNGSMYVIAEDEQTIEKAFKGFSVGSVRKHGRYLKKKVMEGGKSKWVKVTESKKGSGDKKDSAGGHALKLQEHADKTGKNVHHVQVGEQHHFLDDIQYAKIKQHVSSGYMPFRTGNATKKKAGMSYKKVELHGSYSPQPKDKMSIGSKKFGTKTGGGKVKYKDSGAKDGPSESAIRTRLKQTTEKAVKEAYRRHGLGSTTHISKEEAIEKLVPHLVSGAWKKDPMFKRSEGHVRRTKKGMDYINEMKALNKKTKVKKK